MSNVECFSSIKYNCEVQKTKKAKPASFLLIIVWTNSLVGPNYCFFFIVSSQKAGSAAVMV